MIPGHDDGRDKDRQQHQGRGDDGAGDLEHGLGGGRLGVETFVVDDPHGVFHHDDGVVDDDPDDQDQTEHGQPLMDRPRASMTAKVPSSETGMVMAGTRVVRKSWRKR